MTIQLTPEELGKILKFVNQVHKARSGRDRKNKDWGGHRIQRELIGKIGEYGAWKATQIGEVDFEIYATKKVHINCKNDLSDGVHVKTCGLANKGTKTDGWLIGINDAALKNDTHVVIFCYADETGKVEMVGWALMQDLKPYLKLPVNKRLEHKMAWYTEDILPVLNKYETQKL